MKTVAYNVGYAHGVRGLQQHPYLFPADSWEGGQYKQGYIDGAVALENDIFKEKTWTTKQ
jgi:hypothetical protein